MKHATNSLILFALFLFSGIALAQEVPVQQAEMALELPVCIEEFSGVDFSNLPEVALKVLPFFLAALVLLRALAAGLLVIAKKTETKGDDKAAQVITTIANLMAKGLSLVASLSMPKGVLMAKAEKIAIKEMGSGKAKGPGVG